MYGYNIRGHERWSNTRRGRGDNSNTQFGVLGLLYAKRAGCTVPKRVWQKLRDHFSKTQNADGGWSYHNGGGTTPTMALAGTVSLYIAEEQLALGTHTKCEMTPPSRGLEAGMAWVGKHPINSLGAYGFYAYERLGILTGRSEFGGHQWYKEGSAVVLKKQIAAKGWGNADTAFLMLFLSRQSSPGEVLLLIFLLVFWV